MAAQKSKLLFTITIQWMLTHLAIIGLIWWIFRPEWNLFHLWFVRVRDRKYDLDNTKPHQSYESEKETREVIKVLDSTKGAFFEINKSFPGPFPINKGTIMELWGSGLVVIRQMPSLTKKEFKAFTKGFKSYSCFESKTPVPIPVWVFDFPKPHGRVELNFNARIVDAAILSPYLDTQEL